ncbi:hypothetical protein HDU93_007396 [Gonapodya sp. JEL0774]|nr:hypothetical protein HDU93_007396 [Gonapodya sp. JEL0774]
MTFRVSARALRTIDKKGGLDVYLLTTPDKLIMDPLALEVKQRADHDDMDYDNDDADHDDEVMDKENVPPPSYQWSKAVHSVGSRKPLGTIRLSDRPTFLELCMSAALEETKLAEEFPKPLDEAPAIVSANVKPAPTKKRKSGEMEPSKEKEKSGDNGGPQKRSKAAPDPSKPVSKPAAHPKPKPSAINKPGTSYLHMVKSVLSAVSMK